MHKTPCFLATIFFLLSAGCTKDFTINQGTAKPQYVIEGKISNLKGPYYVRITGSASILGPDTPRYSGVDNAEAVQGAEVTITDDMGLVDTLKPIDRTTPCTTLPFWASAATPQRQGSPAYRAIPTSSGFGSANKNSRHPPICPPPYLPSILSC